MQNIFLQVNTTQMLIGLIVGVVALIVMVLFTRIHAFLALILAALITALIGGVPGANIPGMITGGFGGTLGSIGIIIGFGVIMGQIFEESGAAERMARTFIRLFGKGREGLALALTGFIVSIPIFCDSAFVILFPIAKSISQKTRKNLVYLAGALAIALGVTHTVVPPTPGPLFVADEFGVGLGTMILWGLLIAIPMTIAGIAYVAWVSKKLIIVPDEEGISRRLETNDTKGSHYDLKEEPTRELPGTFISFAPILIPILLIVLNQVITQLFTVSEGVRNVLAFIGNPVPAVAVGVLIAIYGLAWGVKRDALMKHMDRGIRSAGIILLVTGAGGALGNVIRATGVGDTIANQITRWGIPAILIPFLIATIIRFIQGSGTVALVTAASISAPILANTNVSPVFAALAAMVGGLFFSYFNDSYFHVVNRSIGISTSKEQLRFWSGATTAAWAVGIVVVVILNAILGGVVR